MDLGTQGCRYLLPRSRFTPGSAVAFIIFPRQGLKGPARVTHREQEKVSRHLRGGLLHLHFFPYEEIVTSSGFVPENSLNLTG